MGSNLSLYFSLSTHQFVRVPTNLTPIQLKIDQILFTCRNPERILNQKSMTGDMPAARRADDEVDLEDCADMSVS